MCRCWSPGFSRNPAWFNSPTFRGTIRRLSCRERTPWRSGGPGTPRSAFPTEFGLGVVTWVWTMPMFLGSPPTLWCRRPACILNPRQLAQPGRWRHKSPKLAESRFFQRWASRVMVSYSRLDSLSGPIWPVAINMQHADVGQIANLPRFRQVRNLPHVADFLRRAIS
jgi:hypothetical protein